MRTDFTTHTMYFSRDELVNGELVEVEYEIRARVGPYVPARTWGPPEYCSPAEGGEVEIVVVERIDPESKRQVRVSADTFTDDEIEKIESDLAEMDPTDYDDYEPDYEPDYDR